MRRLILTAVAGRIHYSRSQRTVSDGAYIRDLRAETEDLTVGDNSLGPALIYVFVLVYAEFSYNNSYQASIEMSPFEALYDRKCTTPLLWSGVGEHSLFGPDIKEAKEKVKLIKDRLKIAQSRQKS